MTGLIVMHRTVDEPFRQPAWFLYDADRDYATILFGVDVPLEWCRMRTRIPANNSQVMESLARYLGGASVDLKDCRVYAYCEGILVRLHVVNRLASRNWGVRAAEVGPNGTSERDISFSVIAGTYDSALLLALLAFRRDALAGRIRGDSSRTGEAQLAEQVCPSSCRAAGSSPAPGHRYEDCSAREDWLLSRPVTKD